MTNLHQCEVIHSVTVQDHGTCAMTRRLAVPGGWVYEVRALRGEREVTLMMVPDPTAPHCQPTPPADDRPPMTDDELEAWLTATYGEPLAADRLEPADWIRWNTTGEECVYMDTSADNADGRRWILGWQEMGEQLPAHVAGPALWSAHRYRNP
jgi:hypothetical protein